MKSYAVVLNLSVLIAFLAFTPFANYQMSSPDLVAGGQQSTTPCNADKDNPYTNSCTGSTWCQDQDLTHYDWSWFNSEEILIQTSIWCGGLEDASNPGSFCTGSAREDNFTTECESNF